MAHPTTFQITTREFIEKTREDINGNSPTAMSFFNKRLPHFKNTINSLDTSIELDRDNLVKMKKALKAMSNNVNAHLENDTNLCKVLEKLGASSISGEEELEIGQAFVKFAAMKSELSSNVKTLMQNLSNQVMFPLESMLKSDLKSINGDFKRPVDRALSDYESRLAKLEKDKRKKTHHLDKIKDSHNISTNSHQFRVNQTSGSYQPEQPSSIELLFSDSIDSSLSTIADKEKRIFQLHLCDYLIRVNEMKTHKGVDLLQHLVEHFNAQATFFREGLKTIEHYSTYISELSQRLGELKIEQDEERKCLIELRNNLKASTPYLDINPGNKDRVDSNFTSDAAHDNSYHPISSERRDSTIHGYSLHQLQGNLSYGFSKSGYLLKKSEGKMRVKAWHRRRCDITDGFLYIYHSDEAKTPTKLNLLTCQVKPGADEERKCFDLVSYNRTYHFQVEDDSDLTPWVSVLINCKEGALKKEFDNSQLQGIDQVDFSPGGSQRIREVGSRKQNIVHIQRSLIFQVRSLPGNNRCVDCSTTSNEPTWLSTNLGVLTCIECSGIHRDLGVQISRIQSLTLDNIGTSQLLIAHNMGNDVFNEVFEAQLNDPTRASLNDVQKPKPDSSMEQRCEFIRAKYMHRKFCTKVHDDETSQVVRLRKAILNNDLKHLLQIFGEGFDLSSKLTISRSESPSAIQHLESDATDDLHETSLHLVIHNQANQVSENVTPKSALHILDFIIQNSRTLNRQNVLGETALHYCIKYNQPESMKLLLRTGADLNIKDSSGFTPLEMARMSSLDYFVELLEQAIQNKKSMFDNVYSDWGVSFSISTESSCEDLSDEQIAMKEKNRTSKFPQYVRTNRSPRNMIHDFNVSVSTLADSSYDYGSSDEENDEVICISSSRSKRTNSRSSSMDENDNSPSFTLPCPNETEFPGHNTPKNNNLQIRKIKQKAFSERKHRDVGFKTPLEVKFSNAVTETELNSSYTLNRHFGSNHYDENGLNPCDRSMTLDRCTSISSIQHSWSQSLAKSKQLSSIFGSSPRNHKFTSSFRNSRTPTSYLRRAVSRTVNKERMQKVKQLLRVDSSKQ